MMHPEPSAAGGRHRWWTLAVLCLGQAMVFVDVSIVNVALPTIGGNLGIADGQLQYLVTVYGATLGGFLILGGRLADLLGHRRMLLTGIVVFVLASVVAGASATPTMLIAARVAQGLGAALLTPAGLAVLNRTFPRGPDRSRAFGIWGALGGLGAVAGVVLGGVLTQAFGWRAIFLINAPIGAIVLAGIQARVRPAAPASRSHRLNVAGGVLMAAGLLALCFGLGELAEGAGSSRIAIVLLAAAAVLLAAAALAQRGTVDPVLPPSLLSRKGLGAVLVLTALAFGTLLTLFFFASLYIHQVLGLTPTLTGIAYLPIAVSVVIGSIIGSSLIERWGTTGVLVAAFGLSTAGTAAIAAAAPLASYALSLLPGFVIAGLGIGSSFVALQVAVMRGVGDADAGVVGGLFGTSQEAGGALALAIATLAAFGLQPAGGAPLRTGFLIASAFALFALVAAIAQAIRTAGRSARQTI